MNLPANLFFINAAGDSVPVSAANPLPTTAGAGPGGSVTSDDIQVAAFTSGGGALTFPGGTLTEALQAIADLADPGA